MSNSDYCNGVQPITIQPDASNEDDDECVPMNTDVTLQPRDLPVTNNAAEVTPGLQVRYCGTLAGNSLLAPGVLSELAQSLVAGFRTPQSVAYLSSIQVNSSPSDNVVSNNNNNLAASATSTGPITAVSMSSNRSSSGVGSVANTTNLDSSLSDVEPDNSSPG